MSEEGKGGKWGRGEVVEEGGGRRGGRGESEWMKCKQKRNMALSGGIVIIFIRKL